MSLHIDSFGGFSFHVGGKGFNDDPVDETSRADRIFQSWQEYFHWKFSDTSQFHVESHDGMDGYGERLIVPKSGACKSMIRIRHYTVDGEEYLEALDMTGGFSPGRYECYFERLRIDQKNVGLVDRLLEVPLTKGWHETVFLYFVVPYKVTAVFPFGNSEYRQTSMHLLGIIPWVLSLFDLFARRAEVRVVPMVKS